MFITMCLPKSGWCPLVLPEQNHLKKSQRHPLWSPFGFPKKANSKKMPNQQKQIWHFLRMFGFPTQKGETTTKRKTTTTKRRNYHYQKIQEKLAKKRKGCQAILQNDSKGSPQIPVPEPKAQLFRVLACLGARGLRELGGVWPKVGQYMSTQGASMEKKKEMPERCVLYGSSWGGGGVAGKITYNVPPRAFKSRTAHCCT